MLIEPMADRYENIYCGTEKMKTVLFVGMICTRWKRD